MKGWAGLARIGWAAACVYTVQSTVQSTELSKVHCHCTVQHSIHCIGQTTQHKPYALYKPNRISLDLVTIQSQNEWVQSEPFKMSAVTVTSWPVVVSHTTYWIQDTCPGFLLSLLYGRGQWGHDAHIMSPVSRSDTILNSNTSEQSSHELKRIYIELKSSVCQESNQTLPCDFECKEVNPVEVHQKYRDKPQNLWSTSTYISMIDHPPHITFKPLKIEIDLAYGVQQCQAHYWTTVELLTSLRLKKSYM